MTFSKPLDGWFTHLAWNIDLRQIGPFVRASTSRDECLRLLTTLTDELNGKSSVNTAHSLEVTFIVPIKGAPQYDLALLVHSKNPMTTELVNRARKLGLPDPAYRLSAQNSGLIGDTEARNGEILLNHFTGAASSATAVKAWKSVSTWYLKHLGVDNSTLLEYTSNSPFLITNYARLPGKVIPFLLGQIIRPSFYIVVQRQLREAGIHPFPLFARRCQEAPPAG